MRALWSSSKTRRAGQSDADEPGLFDSRPAPTGEPLLVPIDRIDEDPDNPRTEFPDADIEELADDIRQHGVLQPIVVCAVAASGRYTIRLGAKRFRAAKRAGLGVVPVTLAAQPVDVYAQVAENQKRHGLTPLELARFIRGRVNAGDSNAQVAKRLGMNLTTVAHHLALLELPPELDQALRSGRCTSPRTLHELSKLHHKHPEQVRALVAGDAEITRSAVSAMRSKRTDGAADSSAKSSSACPLAQVHAACNRLEQALGRLGPSAKSTAAPADLVALHARIAALADRWSEGSDRQTPSQADR
jgi:ParB family transcriptional regulator, chromosome partitioning protein